MPAPAASWRTWNQDADEGIAAFVGKRQPTWTS